MTPRPAGGTVSDDERATRPRPGVDEDTVRFERERLERALFEKRRHQSRWRRLRPILLALLVLALLAGGGWLVFFSPHLRAEEVRVEGAAYLLPDQVRRAAAVPVEPLARVDVDAVEERVEALAPVASASVRRAWPHAVVVRVSERKPVAVLSRGDAWLAMDRTGVTFRSYKSRPPGLPEIADRAGGSAGAAADRDARVEAARVLRALSPELLRRVLRLEATTIDKITLVMRPRGGKSLRVVWGSAADSAAKADVLAVLVKQKVRVIDVSVPGRPTTRA